MTAGTGSGDVISAATYDAAGRTLTASSTTSGATQASSSTHGILDQVLAEDRTGAGGALIKHTYDAAGNETDTCTWTAGMPVGACLPAGTTPWTNPPATVTTSTYDARNSRISFRDGATATEVTYDPAHNYAVAAEYLHLGGTAERGRHYEYDDRDRLTRITDVVCSTGQRPCVAPNIVGSPVVVNEYGYDGNDNRTMVKETVAGVTTTRHYCYDALNQLTAVATTAGCASGVLEAYAYDEAGNRISQTGGGTNRTFTYTAAGNTNGTLQTATSPTVTTTYLDTTGAISRIASTATWSYVYDGEGRMTSACQSSSCTGSGFNRLTFLYDAGGNRTKITATPATGTATTTTFRYRDGLVAFEVEVTGSITITRTFTTGPDGAIAKMVLATTPTPGADDGTYLVRWNGHGDAIGLDRVNIATGALTPVTTRTYTTWGTPTRSGLDLGFRYLYVGSADVQWDDRFGLGLAYMHARHYSPALGRFLQPDPARADASTYRYAGNNPVTMSDPTGLDEGSRGTLLQKKWVKFGPHYTFWRRILIVDLSFGVSILFRGPWAVQKLQSLGWGGLGIAVDECCARR